jgi:hypothetical protein
MNTKIETEKIILKILFSEVVFIKRSMVKYLPQISLIFADKFPLLSAISAGDYLFFLLVLVKQNFNFVFKTLDFFWVQTVINATDSFFLIN